MRRAVLLLMLLVPTASASAETYRNGSVTAEVTGDRVVLENSVAARTWDGDGLRSTVVDRRGQDRTWSAAHPDFTLNVAGRRLSSGDMTIDRVTVTPIPRGGLRVAFELSHTAPLLTVTRIVEAYPGVAGFRSRMEVASPVPLPLTSYTLDEVAVGDQVTPTIHAFRAGADWRGESDWEGPELGSVGPDHAGDWRETNTAPKGRPVSDAAQWVSVQDGDRALFQALETNDLPSARAFYDGDVASTRVDHTRDVLILGPLEESGHVENPREEEAGRARTLTPGGLLLPAAFTGLARGDGDEGWQWQKYLVEQRIQAFPRSVVFNSDATDQNQISTGAKDDMNYAAVKESAPVARALGADVFTLDDGWQAASGDWQPDSPAHRDPRVDDPTYQGDRTKLAPRFPDADFVAVREAIAPMDLGLWWTPTSFHPKSKVYQQNPQWACAPTGDATGASGIPNPDSSSNEAGLGVWSVDYLPFLEQRLVDAIENWDVKLFKFDFIVWLDCLGANDLYEAHDAFLALFEKLHARYPDVAFSIDETNDYRLFPFESTLLGPTWFTNGGPSVAQVLHNTWSLAPWIPAMSLGQKVLTGSQRNGNPVATAVAATLLNQQMITEDLRPSRRPEWAGIAEQARPWFDWGKANRDRYLSGVVYPLLDDPLGGQKWTALQSWNPEAGRGALLAFRQDDPRPSVEIALRNVPGGTYELRAAPTDEPVGVVDATELREGLEVALPARGARVLTIDRR